MIDVVFRNSRGFVTDFGHELTAEADGAVVLRIPRFGVWQPIRGKPQVTLTTNDFSEAKHHLEPAMINCVHCGEPIGIVPDERDHWRHHPEDGPDSYLYCRCQCGNHTDASLCCDGEEATPEPKSANV